MEIVETKNGFEIRRVQFHNQRIIVHVSYDKGVTLPYVMGLDYHDLILLSKVVLMAAELLTGRITIGKKGA